ncbi:signal recognition particle protein, partial [Rhodovulum sulfidophilum]|nr:signal recognition particle protein [Rhodovulum sulfidophilum]
SLEVPELNKLLKMHRQMSDMMKKLGQKGGRAMLKKAMGGMFGKGGMPDMANMDQAQMEEAARKMGAGLPGGMGGGMGGMGGGMGLPPGLGGLGGFGKKK